MNMKRETVLVPSRIFAVAAGLSVCAGAAAQPVAEPGDPAKPAAVPGARPGEAVKPKSRAAAKPAMVDLQDAAKAVRKRPARVAPGPISPAAAVVPSRAATPAVVDVAPQGAGAAVTRPAMGKPVTDAGVSGATALPVTSEPVLTAAPMTSPVAATEPTGAGASVSVIGGSSGASGPVVDIESVAVKPAKGELRRSPVDIGGGEPARSGRSGIAAAEPQATTPTATESVAGEPAPIAAVPAAGEPVDPVASLLPAVAASSVVPESMLRALSGTGATAGVPSPTAASTPEAKAAVEPTPVVDAKPAPVPALVVATGPIEPPAEVPTPKPEVVTPPASSELVVKPSVEPLPPVPPNPKAESTAVPAEVVTKPIEPTAKPSEPVAIAPASAVADPYMRPVTATEPERGAASTSVPVAAAPADVNKPIENAASSPATVVTTPAPTAVVPTASAASAPAGEPQPVRVKVLSLTGTPGMVQWQAGTAAQWHIPEVDESAKGMFTVRTGPDAGVEVLVDDGVRVRLGRFSRAEVRAMASGEGAQVLNINLLRGMCYIVPPKGTTVVVQTPERAVTVTEPTQITHDNGGTRSVSFVEQPNPGSTATAPGANP